MKTVVHVGSGRVGIPTDYWPRSEWREVSVDLDPSTTPDIVADCRDMGEIADESADAIYCSHVLEHVPEADLQRVLAEFRRILKPDGELVVGVPDIQEAARWIADGRVCETMYECPAGDGTFRPIRPLDLIYGAGTEVRHRPLMGHRTGFTQDTLSWWLSQAGFEGEMVNTGEDGHSLVACVRKNGAAPLFETLPADKEVIILTQSATVESLSGT